MGPPGGSVEKALSFFGIALDIQSPRIAIKATAGIVAVIHRVSTAGKSDRTIWIPFAGSKGIADADYEQIPDYDGFLFDDFSAIFEDNARAGRVRDVRPERLLARFS